MNIHFGRSFIKPGMMCLDANLWAHGRAIAPPQKPIEKLPGRTALLMVHFPVDPMRTHVISSITAEERLEMIERECQAHEPGREVAGVTPLSDDVGGSFKLLEYLRSEAAPNRYILTGGDVRACLRTVFNAIVSVKRTGSLEFYFPLDGLFIYHEDDVMARILTQFVTGYFAQEAAGKRSAAIWHDDILLSTTAEDPQIRIRIYSSTERMLAALS